MTQVKYATLASGNGEPMMLQRVHASGELHGLLLAMTVVQEFVNTSNKHAEVVYTFPLPWRAVLLGVNIKLGDQHFSGIVVEKNQAEAEYEEALSEGNTAILLQENSDQSYSLNLGNLAAKAVCSITLRYAQTLQFMQHEGQSALRLLIPTVIAPHYGEVIKTGLPTLHRVEHDLLADYPFDIHLRLQGELAHARVASPSHPVGVAFTEDCLTVNLARRGALDRDFVLLVDQLRHQATCQLAADYLNPEHTALLASFCPQLPDLPEFDLAAKILVDCSGSMNGNSIASAKLALIEIVQQLRPTDRFSLSRFGDAVTHRSRALWKCGEASRHAAKRWINALQADMGGTEMEGALKSTFALGSTVRSDVLLITDGQISDIEPLIATAMASGQRIFIVGIGSAVSQANLHRLAEATGGVADFLAPGEDVAPAILRMFARLRSARLSGLRLAWTSPIVPIWTSPLPAAVFIGDTINLFGLLPAKPDGSLRLMGSLDNNHAEIEIACLVLDGAINLNTDISRMGAASLIPSELSAQSIVKDMKQTLALDYQLVSPSTSFILTQVRPESERALDMPELHKVKHSVPAGWGGAGSLMFSRKVRSGNDYESTDIRSLSRPAVWRRESASDQVRSLNKSVMETYDIPAFLRKQIGTEYAQSRSDQAHYQGLTPIGLVNWLKNHHWGDWPQDYVGLLRIGVGVAVVEWLELVATNKARQQLSQQAVIATFLKWIVKNNALNQLAPVNWLVSVTRFIALSDKTKKMEKEIAALYYAPDLEAKLDQLLVKLKKNQWPDTIFALELEVMTAEENSDADAA